MLSVFTATHNTQYLLEAYESLLRQTAPWEWILVPNNGAKITEETILEDDRVRICPFPKDDADVPIGALKKFACDQARGLGLVELDHDDILIEGILNKVLKLIEGGSGFVYSDNALFAYKDGQFSSTSYDERYGWETYPFSYDGKEYEATRAFPASARSLCEIFFAPDHVRCWSRKAYDDAGGYDSELFVGDDHDLICRTYIKSQAPFSYIPEVGYLYRLHAGQTVKNRNAAIQKQQAINRDKYIYRLIDAWLRRNGLIMLDLSGDSVQWGSDGSPSIQAANGTIGCFKSYAGLERLSVGQIFKLVEEIHRVLVPGGWWCSKVATTAGPGGFSPLAKSFWNSYTFEHFCNSALRKAAKVDAHFQAVRYHEFMGKLTDHDSQTLRSPFLQADLCAIKGQRQAGRVF